MFRSFRKLTHNITFIRTMATGMTKGRLDGKVAIVTASTDGIGFAIAQRLGQEGAHVVVSSRKQKNVDSAIEKLKQENIRVSGRVCHVGKDEDRKLLIETTVQEQGGLDILVSNAGINPIFGPIFDTDEKSWDKIFDTNVKAGFFLCKEAFPHMEKRGGGSILFVSSIAGFIPFQLLGPYSISKTALLGLTKALVPQCAQKNIRVNALAPGVIKTNFSETLWNNPSLEKQISENISLGRFGTAEECAGAAAFLASDDARYITGETIMITGGMYSSM